MQKFISINTKLRIYEHEIARGSFGKVFKGIYVDEKGIEVDVAVKITLTKEEKELKNFQTEIDVLKKLNHPNIIKYYGAGVWKGSAYIVIEWCPGGTLQDCLNKMKSPFNEEEARVIFKSLAIALKYMHDNGFAHRDLKPCNILIGVNNELKLADFGTAKMSGNDMAETLAGTPYYMPIEMLSTEIKTYDPKKSDIWSAGLTLWKLIKNQEFWYKAKSQIQLYNFQKEFKGLNGNQIKGLSPELIELFSMILKIDFNQRPTIDQILESSWLKPPPVDLSMTTQKLLESVIHPEPELSDDNQTLIKYLRKTTEEQLNSKMEEFESKIMRIFEEIEKLIKTDNDEREETIMLKFAMLLKINNLLDKPFKDIKFVKNANNLDVMLKDVLAQKTLEKFIYSKTKITKSLQDIYELIKDLVSKSGIIIQGNNPNTILIQYIILHLEKWLFDDMLGSHEKEMNKVYLIACIGLHLLMFDIDWIRVDIKIDYERLKKVGVEVDRSIIEKSISEDKINLFEELTNLDLKQILDLEQKLKKSEREAVKQRVALDKGREGYHHVLLQKFAPVVKALKSRCDKLSNFNKDEFKMYLSEYLHFKSENEE